MRCTLYNFHSVVYLSHGTRQRCRMTPLQHVSYRRVSLAVQGLDLTIMSKILNEPAEVWALVIRNCWTIKDIFNGIAKYG